MTINKEKYSVEDKKNLSLVVAMRRALHPEERSLSDIISDYGLTISQFAVLDALYHLGCLNINQIIEKTLSTSGNMTVVIRNLVKLKLITKKRDPNDGRAFLIEITEAGHNIMAELFPKHLISLNKIFDGLDDQEKDNLLDLLKKLNKYDRRNTL